MTSLAEKEGLKGQVQMVYIDPPYGIKFGSNWQVSTRRKDVKDGKAADATRQPEQVRAFRDTWEFGIHSYLGYLRDRLVATRELLTDSGSVFVQIGDENVHLVRALMDEVFGAENFCGQIVYQKTGGFAPTLLSLNVDYIVWYAKSKDVVKFRPTFMRTEVTAYETAFYDFVDESDGRRRPLTKREKADPTELPPDAKILSRNPLVSDGYVESLDVDPAIDVA